MNEGKNFVEKTTPQPMLQLEDVSVLMFAAVSLVAVDMVVEETSTTMVASTTMVLTIVLNASCVGRRATMFRGVSRSLIERSLVKRRVYLWLLHHMTLRPTGMLTHGLPITLLENLTS
jgi:hypothetical protein